MSCHAHVIVMSCPGESGVQLASDVRRRLRPAEQDDVDSADEAPQRLSAEHRVGPGGGQAGARLLGGAQERVRAAPAPPPGHPGADRLRQGLPGGYLYGP